MNPRVRSCEQEKLWGQDCAMLYAHKANGVTAGLLFLQIVKALTLHTSDFPKRGT